MKRNLLAITMAAIFAACNSNPKTSTQTNTVATVDSSSFRNNSFADRGQVIELKGVSDTIVTGDGNRYVKVDPNQPAQNLAATATPPASVKVPTSTTRRSTAKRPTRSSGSRSNGGSSGNGSSGGGYSGSGNETVSTPAPAEKKGWSKAAKGAAIGAGVGAVGGAVISKKKGLGAVIGGVVGGAGGYIIGRNKDKKDGRY